MSRKMKWFAKGSTDDSKKSQGKVKAKLKSSSLTRKCDSLLSAISTSTLDIYAILMQWLRVFISKWKSECATFLVNLCKWPSSQCESQFLQMSIISNVAQFPFTSEIILYSDIHHSCLRVCTIFWHVIVFIYVLQLLFSFLLH